MNKIAAQNRQKAFNKMNVQAYRRAIVEQMKPSATFELPAQRDKLHKMIDTESGDILNQSQKVDKLVNQFYVK